MQYTVEQIQKHTILSRLAVSVYKMNNEQLDSLLDKLEPGPDGKRPPIIPSQVAMEKRLQQWRALVIARIFVLIHQLDKLVLLQRLERFEDSDFQWVREFPRLSCFLAVDFASEGRSYRSCIRDISAGGVFIETAHLFEVDQEIALCFTLSEANERCLLKSKGLSRGFTQMESGCGIKI
jgi:hypothetical protein